MKTTYLNKKNLFIVDNDPEVTVELKNHIEARYNNMFEFSLFHTGKSAQEACDERADIIIINNYLTGENGSEIAGILKKAYPKLNIIMLTSTDEVLNEIQKIVDDSIERVATTNSYVEPASFPVTKRRSLIYPFQFIMKEFRTRKYLLIFTLTFVTIGAIILIVMNSK